MVRSFHNSTCQPTRRLVLAHGLVVVIFVLLGSAATLSAQQPRIHYNHAGILAPGAIGSGQLQRGGPLPGYFQPVEIRAPEGSLISLAVNSQFQPAAAAPVRAGLLIGSVYRFKVTNIPQSEGMEVYPSVELVNRIYPPPGQELKFPIPVDLTETDLKLALQGHFITRVIYLENPQQAVPINEDPKEQQWFEVEAHEDPLAVADRLGRPVAILRLGGRLPNPQSGQDSAFFFGGPPLLCLPRPQEVIPHPLEPEKQAQKPELKKIVSPALPRTR